MNYLCIIIYLFIQNYFHRTRGRYRVLAVRSSPIKSDFQIGIHGS